MTPRKMEKDSIARALRSIRPCRTEGRELFLGSVFGHSQRETETGRQTERERKRKKDRSESETAERVERQSSERDGVWGGVWVGGWCGGGEIERIK